jgi:Fe-S cluster assembly ATP-binding protein
MLEIKNLQVKLEDEDKQILKGVDLTIEPGTVHAIMGPNGSGKSTLSYVLSGKDGYEVTGGEASLEGQDLLEMEPEERAALGLFLAFQYPVEIPGVGNMTFLRTAVNAQRKARGEEELSAMLICSNDRSMSVFPAARKNAMKSCRWQCLSQRCAFWTKLIPDLMLMP